jgi:hypothetical protein
MSPIDDRYIPGQVEGFVDVGEDVELYAGIEPAGVQEIGKIPGVFAEVTDQHDDLIPVDHGALFLGLVK